MSTDLGNFDQFLPQSKTETFARQLQSRLRSLSNDSTEEGTTEANWNGDHLSSSSENDVYYDLESCPSSPVEEALESEFASYTEHNGAGNSSRPIYSTHFDEPLLALYSDEPHAVNQGLQDCKCGYDNDLPLGESQYSQNASVKSNSDGNSNGKGPPISPISLQSSHCNYSSQMNNSSYKLADFKDENMKREMSNHLHLNKVSSIEKFTIDNYSDNGINKYQYDIPPINANHAPSSCLWDNGYDCHLKTAGNGIQDYKTKNSIPESGIDHQRHLSNDMSNNEESHNGTIMNCDGSSKNNIFPSMSSSSNETENRKGLIHEDVFENNNNILLYSDTTDETKIPLSTYTDETKRPLSTYTDETKRPSSTYTDEALEKLVDTVFNNCRRLSLSEETSSTDLAQNTNSERNSKEKNLNEDEEESIEVRRLRFRRSSSLKSGKTPPGTPGKKKIVRFADVLGLDLADVRTFMDEIPKVPKSAFEDLKGVELSSSPVRPSFFDFIQQPPPPPSQGQKTIVPLFEQPSCRTDFLDRVKDYYVCLENAMVSDAALSTITGVVRVRNIDFHKSVYIRYSIDAWKSFADLQARYVPSSCDGLSDKFSFVLYAHMLNVGQKMEFAVRFQAGGCQYWDNNKGANYVFQCITGGHAKQNLSLYVPPSPIETWASFY